MNNSLTTRKVSAEGMPLSSYLAQPKIKSMITESLTDGKAFTTALISAVAANPELRQCTNESLYSAALCGASLELPMSATLGYFYIVPFKDKKLMGAKTSKATFVLGWKGIVQLALRTGQFRKINVFEVKENEFKGWNPMTEEIDINISATNDLERQKLKTVGYYVSFELINGFQKAMYWTKNAMIAHADTYSKAFSAETYLQVCDGTYKGESWKISSFWYKSFDEMAKKTMLRQLLGKWGPASVQMAKALSEDNDEKVEDPTNTQFTEAEEAEVVQESTEKADKLDVEIDNPETTW